MDKQMSNVEWDELIHIEMVENVVEAKDYYLDCVHAEDGLHLHGVRVVQDMHEADESAKRLEISHVPLALVAHTGSSSRTSSQCYVTHPSSMVDYDGDYQGDTIQNNLDDPLTSVMILLACAITRNFSNPTNNHLHTSSKIINQDIVQGDRVNIHSKNSDNDGRNTRHAYVQEEVIENTNIQNNTGKIQRTI
nr:hypothetical protein [Tanacetum cinerariifolium]